MQEPGWEIIKYQLPEEMKFPKELEEDFKKFKADELEWINEIISFL